MRGNMQTISLTIKIALAALVALVVSSSARAQAVPYEYEVRWSSLAGSSPKVFGANAFNFSVEQIVPEGGGGGAGITKFAPARIVKAWDDASPALMLGCATGVHYMWVEVVMYASGKKGVGAPLQTIKFEDVLITGFSQNAADHALGALGLNQQMGTLYERNHQEELAIKFRKITITNHASGNVATYNLG
jgi:type VI secretion system Hcp family effector